MKPWVTWSLTTVAIASLACADGSHPMAKGDATIMVYGKGKGELVDPMGRRDGWRLGRQVAEIPNCERSRWTDPDTDEPDSISDGRTPEADEFDLSNPLAGWYRIELTPDSGGWSQVVVSATSESGKVTRATSLEMVRLGRRYVWRLKVGSIRDSLTLELSSHPSIQPRKTQNSKR